MSSDREKISCLKILAEVEQYVLQDKRDACEVAEILKPIINGPEPEEKAPPLTEEQKKIAEKIIRQTEDGLLNWKCQPNGSYGYKLFSEIDGQKCEIYLDYPSIWPNDWPNTWRDIWHLRLITHEGCFGKWIEILLSKNEKKMFFAVYLQKKKSIPKLPLCLSEW